MTRFAPCSQTLFLLGANCSWFPKFSSLFRGVCYMFSRSPAFRERFALGSQSSSLFRAFCSLLSSFPVSSERFAPCVLKRSCFLERFAPSCQELGLLFALKFPSLFRAVCSFFSNSLVLFERFDPCSQILYFLCSGLLFVLKFSSPSGAVCYLFLNSVVSFERFALCSEIL